MRFMRPRYILFLLFCLAAGLGIGPARYAVAQEAYSVSYNQAEGLDAGEIAAVAQDNRGFIWIGANGGLIRFDGLRFEPWAPATLHQLVSRIVTDKTGQVILDTFTGEVLAVSGTDVVPLAGPDGAALTNVYSLVFDDSNRLWLIWQGATYYRAPDHTWHRLDTRAMGNQTPLHLRRLLSSIAVVTDKGIWAFGGPAQAPVQLYTGQAMAISQSDSDVYWILEVGGRLWEKRGQRRDQRPVPPGRIMSMTVRNKTLWIAIDRFLAAYTPSGQVRVIGPAQGLASGGPLLVDRENGLWLGTFIGLQYFPEPDTYQWTQAEGLNSNHAYQVFLTPASVWLSTWQGVNRLPVDRPQTRFRTVQHVPNPICSASGADVLFKRGARVYLERGATTRIRLHLPSPDTRLNACLEDPTGDVFVATDGGLYTGGASAGMPWRRVVDDLPAGNGIEYMWPAGDHRLWLADDANLCSFDPNAPAPKPMACFPAPPGLSLRAGVSLDSRTAWLATDDGLYSFHDGHFAPVHLTTAPVGRSLLSVTASPRGGYWMVGPGTFERIMPRAGHGDSADIVEVPSLSQGLPGNEAIQVTETPAGDLWVAGNRGLFRVPAVARTEAPRPQKVVVVAASIDGQPVKDPGVLHLKASQHRLVLSLSALSFKDPVHVLFRFRMHRAKTWSPPSTTADLQFIDPAAGRYDLDIAASIDGRTWSEPVSVRFDVSPPWWASSWAYLAYALLLVAIVTGLDRLRLAHVLSLERQRLRIAMDLHDEIGSNLGSIGLLANQAGRTTLTAGRQNHIFSQIKSLTQLTSIGLRLMGRSLKHDRATVAELVRDIKNQVARLVPDDGVGLTFDMTAGEPEAVIGAAVYRHALMIVVEAVHNALKYAQASHLTITLDRPVPGRCRLTISDDGKGFDVVVAATKGSGLENMRKRAAEAGGTLEIQSEPGQGTRLTLTFSCAKPRGAGVRTLTRNMRRLLSGESGR